MLSVLIDHPGQTLTSQLVHVERIRSECFGEYSILRSCIARLYCLFICHSESFVGFIPDPFTRFLRSGDYFVLFNNVTLDEELAVCNPSRLSD